VQELQDLGNSFKKAPKCSWSPIPPPELRGENVQHLTTNGGFVSFGTSPPFLLDLCFSVRRAGVSPTSTSLAGVLSRHVRGKRAARTAWILLNFQTYVKYHIKVSPLLSDASESQLLASCSTPLCTCSAQGATSRAG
jgi:actin related protein 2/3 complex, subunit 2